jgi:DNA-binding NarL/FixJ family response regulator
MSTPTPTTPPVEPVTLAKYGLTGREVQMLEMLSFNKSNQEIAEVYKTSEQVVKNRFFRLFKRMKVRSRAAAVAKGLREGIIK